MAGKTQSSDALKQLHGTLRKDRARARKANASKTSSYAEVSPPSPPADLSDDARATWLELAPIYAVDQPAVAHLLAQLCRTDALLRQAEAEVASNGFTISSKGATKANPAVSAARNLRSSLDGLRRRLDDMARPATPAPAAGTDREPGYMSLDEYLATKPDPMKPPRRTRVH
jgi:phage terminase small subunit